MIDLQVWIILAVICLLGELITTSFFLLWFAIGASFSAVLNYLGFDPLIQFVVFIVISIILLATSRKFAQRITKESPKKAASDRLIGKKAKVVEKIDLYDGGLVEVEGDTWRAISSQSINKDEIVEIKRIDSVKLVVDRIVNKNDTLDD